MLTIQDLKDLLPLIDVALKARGLEAVLDGSTGRVLKLVRDISEMEAQIATAAQQPEPVDPAPVVAVKPKRSPRAKH